MRSYLHLTASGFDVLIETDRVREVMALTPADHCGEAGAFRAWRGDVLPVIDLGRALGHTGGTREASIVCDSPESGRVFVDVDRVGKVMRLEDEDFRRLPPLPSRVAAAFDGLVAAADGGRGLLRLRGNADILSPATASSPDSGEEMLPP